MADLAQKIREQGAISSSRYRSDDSAAPERPASPRRVVSLPTRSRVLCQVFSGFATGDSRFYLPGP